MNILGIAGAVHDAAAALLQDGQLVAAVEEEEVEVAGQEVLGEVIFV